MAVIPQTALEHDKNSNVSSRKPRVYASFTKPTSGNPIPLDFCVWLQTYFDDVITINEEMRTCDHKWMPTLDLDGKRSLDPTYVCRCGAIYKPVEVISGSQRRS